MATIIKGKNPKRPWTVRYWDANATTRSGVQGKQCERSYATQREARDFVAKFEHDRREHIFTDPRNGKIGFADYVATWIETLDIAPSTKIAYRSSLNAHIRPWAGDRTLAQVAADRDGVWAFIQGMDRTASRRSAVLTVVLQAVREAVRSRRIASHNLEGLSVRADALHRAEIPAVTSEQIAALAAGLKPGMSLTVWIMRGAGLRISECLAVRLDDFRDDGRTLRVQRQVLRDGTLGPLKARRAGQYRDVPVPSWLWRKVLDHVVEHGTDGDGGFLFGRGERITHSRQHSRFMTSVRRAGLTGLTEHGLRHLYVSTLLAAGVPITDVAAWCGHKNITITFAIYGHLLPDSWTRGREALELLAA